MSEENYGQHYSVLKEECLNYLTEKNSEREALFADLTFGAGGHTTSLALKHQKSLVLATDQDPDAILNGEKFLKSLGLENRIELLKMNFSEFADFYDQSWKSNHPQYNGIDGILMDLGVSSHQFDTFSRGFSFREDGPLDMRMDYDNNEKETAADIINNYREEDIANILFLYGEERYSRRIAKNICLERKIKPITTTKELENLIFHSYPEKDRHRGAHPATRSFQALRIAVNAELTVLEESLEKLFSTLGRGGRLCVISFHSLEDRIVKHTFKEIVEKNPNCATILTKKPILPSDQELQINSRSRSAKLRVIEKSPPPSKDAYDKDKKEKQKQILDEIE
ncbi:MAG: 16S rRNA (cytosine(1402)-N(4))-methyltransferase RsmH [Bacteriovoracaceae bacterium]